MGTRFSDPYSLGQLLVLRCHSDGVKEVSVSVHKYGDAALFRSEI